MSSPWMCISNLPRLIGSKDRLELYMSEMSKCYTVHPSLPFVLFFIPCSFTYSWEKFSSMETLRILWIIFSSFEYVSFGSLHMLFILICGAVKVLLCDKNIITLVHLRYIISTYLQDLAKLAISLDETC